MDNATVHEVPYETIDPEIQTIIRLMNRFSGIRTLSSCAGHEEGQDGYVAFAAATQHSLYRFLKALSYLNYQVVDGKGVKWGFGIVVDADVHLGYIRPNGSSSRNLVYELGEVPVYRLNLSCSSLSEKPRFLDEIEEALRKALGGPG